eukprot:597623-Pelagomonas_calceolata.AAC.2
MLEHTLKPHAPGSPLWRGGHRCLAQLAPAARSLRHGTLLRLLRWEHLSLLLLLLLVLLLLGMERQLRRWHNPTPAAGPLWRSARPQLLVRGKPLSLLVLGWERQLWDAVVVDVSGKRGTAERAWWRCWHQTRHPFWWW